MKFLQFLPYLMMSLTIVGTIANAFQKRWCFWLWAITNAYWCIRNAVLGEYAQAALYAFNCVTSVVGLIQWRKKETKKQET